MRLGVCYVCPMVNWPQFEPLTKRFLATSESFPAGYAHEFHVICNGGPPNAAVQELFANRNPIFHEHDNTGWDIGGFDKIAATSGCDLMLFLGTNSHFKRAGWLARMMEVRNQLGPGLYGVAASFDIRPHLRTNGFLCEPQLVCETWAKNRSHSNPRHGFEVRQNSLADTAAAQGLPVMLVTWDGYYARPDWRKAPNIYRRGDQSNCLIYDRHHEIYEAASPVQKIRLERIADGNKFEYYRSAIQARLMRWFSKGK